MDPHSHSATLAARRSLDGLSVGDAFGELFFYRRDNWQYGTFESLPAGRWRWTDDTHMALSIVETLEAHGRIDQDALARRFANRFAAEPWRGYARGAASLLDAVRSGGDWRGLSRALFGNGSYGNGGAMRVAPVGAFFSQDLDRVVRESAASAEVTHAHPEGQAGAIAVGVATALALTRPDLRGVEFLRATLARIPEGETRRRTLLACDIPADDCRRAFVELGTGAEVSAQDTVPFCLWAAAYHLGDFAAAMWHTVRVPGDIDTLCAIVGGIVGVSVETIPAEWLSRREPLPMARTP
ncbi:MAG TPA: hypothetical protein DCM86_06640 [Verrucomicrobiales bacterium]|nr:hypothetical protein [Verrucomicrobiales bacterium]